MSCVTTAGCQHHVAHFGCKLKGLLYFKHVRTVSLCMLGSTVVLNALAMRHRGAMQPRERLVCSTCVAVRLSTAVVCGPISWL